MQLREIILEHAEYLLKSKMPTDITEPYSKLKGVFPAL